MQTAEQPDAGGAEGADEHLTDGWEPDAPLEDTLVRHFTFALAAADRAPVRAMGGRTLERDDVVAADLGTPNGVGNAAVLTRPPGEHGWQAVLGDVEDFFAPGSGRVHLWSPWPTPDLRPRGWALDGHPPLLVRPPGGGPLPAAPSDLDIRQVTDAETLVDFERVVVEGFPLEELQPFQPGAWLDERVLEAAGHELFVGYVDGRAVSAGWLLEHEGLSVLVLGATLAQVRRRGYWRGMLVHRLARSQGRVVASVFSDMSRPGAERYGFLPVTRLTLWHRDRGRA